MPSDHREATHRSDWRSARFDQIADNIAERVEPAEADTDIYVGLEHLDPDSLRLRRWGTPADVEGTKLRFYTGDVIFGRRRAYQRKLAVAESEGICSAHAMVLRAKPDICLPEFLPFFLQSERFFERAIAISVGSLSPTINWKTLAVQEFSLPPLDEQRRIAEILLAAEDAIESWRRVITATGEVIQSATRSVYRLGASSAHDHSSSASGLSDLAELDPAPPNDLRDDAEVSFVTMADVSIEGGIVGWTQRLVRDVRRGYTFFADGDILFPKITPCMENGKGAIATELHNGMGYGSTEFFVLRPKDQKDTLFLYYLLMAPEFRQEAARMMRGSAGQQRVPREFLRNYRLAVLTVLERQEGGEMLGAIDRCLKAQNIHLNLLGVLSNKLREHLLSPSLQ